MTRVKIAVPPRPYEAVIETGLLQRADAYLREVLSDRQRVFVVTLPPVRRKWGRKLMASLSAAGFTPKLVEMRDCELHKKLSWVEELSEKLTRSGADRNAVILVFCGGVGGEESGLLCSLY